MSLLDKNEDQVLRMVQDGSLAWAFNVASFPQRGQSMELRILPACVADYLRGQTCSLEWTDVLGLLLPHDDPLILAKDITRVLNVSSTHLYHLVRRKVLTPCSAWRRGPGGCARFRRNSFVQFLKDRRFV